MPDSRTDVPDDPTGPTWVGRTEIGHAEDVAAPARFTSARLLVCHPTPAGTVPVAQVELPLARGRASAAEVARAASAAAGHVPQPPPVSAEPVTVVVATRGRPDSVRRCVQAVLAGDHPAMTVLVVDNDPPDDRTERVVTAFSDERVRYVSEPRRGASAGRNRGLSEARTPIVAFTDDDTEPDTAWASRIAGAFAADPELAGVSGPVLAARLETPQERAADLALAWNKGFAPRRFSLAEPPDDSAVFPFSPGLFGIGANMAVRVDAVRALGGFDEALGPGARTAGGEDIELLVRIVLDGRVLGYVPSAFVWHHHRPSDGELRSQMRGYALGLGAFLGKVALDPRARAAAVRRLPAAAARLRHIVRRESGDVATGTPGVHVVTGGNGGDSGAAAAGALPDGAGARTLRGLVSGPLLYLRSRRRVREDGGVAPPLTRPDGEPPG
ncbi:glycosyltransferase family 2 protein [Pseudonocardia endophytica]|uniref:Glycosyl transferase family 2 n=1 Tax=Pseudonocardia endophytica TaxID=401976 RepID=A0A4V2PIM0_PSEEN|nr:glycosyltransferase [Pseudonocardia endophytica]TCK25126.1 glycosyl transferase family 2 [Pseudonocardia endophytica]